MPYNPDTWTGYGGYTAERILGDLADYGRRLDLRGDDDEPITIEGRVVRDEPTTISGKKLTMNDEPTPQFQPYKDIDDWAEMLHIAQRMATVSMDMMLLTRTIGSAAWWDSLPDWAYERIRQDMLPVLDRWREIWENATNDNTRQHRRPTMTTHDEHPTGQSGVGGWVSVEDELPPNKTDEQMVEDGGFTSYPVLWRGAIGSLEPGLADWVNWGGEGEEWHWEFRSGHWTLGDLIVYWMPLPPTPAD